MVWKKPRVKVGGIYKAKTKLFSKDYFALLRVTRLRKERLGDISPEDAQAEGGYSIEQFKRIWKEINGSWDPEQEVWVVEFEMLDQARCNKAGDRGK
ncbi:hypothetical protein Asulf_01143 [Archaeoglobus sulfaticallidus PM70-1]|uniref:ASCH domain-containing protein n=2 Tax=Archaeoglobus TaxID=2233 RepID=N0BDR1_9EURY|nr:hypothetical protein Asulf_01143 [Archaeoglobus sulfaticallidus PM70-1]